MRQMFAAAIRGVERSARPRLARLLAVLVALGALGFGMADGTPTQPLTHGDQRQSQETTLGHSALAELAPLHISPWRRERVARFIEDIDESCLVAGMIDIGTPSKWAISHLFRVISRSDLGQQLLRTAQARNVLVCFDANTNLMAYYRAGSRLIGLKPDLKTGSLIAYLAHELSHVPQHSAYSDNRYYPPRDLILLRRIREASAEAFSTRIAWQLKQKGYRSAWNLKRRDPFYGDIVRAFEREMARDNTLETEIRATRAAFDTWFLVPARLDVYDRMTIAHLERISGDPLGLVPPRRALTHGFLIGLGHMADGNFADQSPHLSLVDPFYSGNISANNLDHLSEILNAAGRGEEISTVSDAFIGSGPDSKNPKTTH